MTNIEIMREITAYLIAANKKVYLAPAPTFVVDGVCHLVRSGNFYSISDAIEYLSNCIGDISLYDAKVSTSDDKNVPPSKRTVYNIRFSYAS